MSEETQEPETLIPETVQAVTGELQYEAFKELYKSVYDQVEDMNHLLMGRLKYSATIGKIPFTVRSLKQSESAILSTFFPMNQDDTETAKKLITFEIYKVALVLQEINGQTLPDPGISLTTTAEEWLKSAEGVIDIVSGYDATILSFISNTYEDMVRAKQFAFIELMPRP